MSCFNPLPSQKQGETISPERVQRVGRVSIRSPHKSKGRQILPVRSVSSSVFQSAPLTKARGDITRVAPAFVWTLFQSAPLTKARGDPSASKTRVSNRAFQSAPLTKARGDRRDGEHRGVASQCFNPLPSQKQGETSLAARLVSKVEVSIRSPHKSKGRLGRSYRSICSGVFQSAPLTKARGDAAQPPRCGPPISFQSAPLTKARGDWRGLKLSEGSPLVSIRSPHKSKGRLPLDGPVRVCARVSIRSPHKSKGRPAGNSGTMTQSQVSIRSPHKSKGRPPPARRGRRGNSFQSAPLTKARGDEHLTVACARQRRFNPLPSQKQGETQ